MTKDREVQKASLVQRLLDAYEDGISGIDKDSCDRCGVSLEHCLKTGECDTALLREAAAHLSEGARGDVVVGDLVWLPNHPQEYLRHRIGVVTKRPVGSDVVVTADFGKVGMQGAGGVHAEPSVTHQAHVSHFQRLSQPPGSPAATPAQELLRLGERAALWFAEGTRTDEPLDIDTAVKCIDGALGA